MKLAEHQRPLLASLGVLLALYAAAAARYHDVGFFSIQVLINLFVDNAFWGIVAVGMTFVILSGGIDLSVGAALSLASVVVGVLIMNHHWPPWLAMLAALTMGTLLGAGMGCVIHFVGLQPFIVTLAGMFLARGLGFLIHLESIGIDHPQHLALQMVALPLPAGHSLPLTAVIFLLTVLAGLYLARYTTFGRAVYAIGGNEEAALLMGLPVGRVKIGVYALSGFCAALGAIVLTLDLSSGSHIEGVGLELDAIAAVVIGGTLLTGGVGSVLGTLIGVLIIGIVVTVITTYEGIFSSGLTRVAIGTLLLLFVLLQRFLGRSAAGSSPQQS